MKTKISICMQIIFLMICTRFAAQTTISGIINAYAPVISVSSHSVSVPDSSVTDFRECDKVLIIQMKGSSIDVTNTSSYGTILNYYQAGNYEFAYISSISGNIISFTSPLLRSYNTSGLVQLIRVPLYTNVTVSGLLTCSPWNGSTGGVLVFEASSVLTLNADIDVSANGFKGGALYNGSYTSSGNFNYVEPAPSLYAGAKGEGIFVTSYLTTVARGCNANGGGGGNDINGGGAGGSNYGAGGTGGSVHTSASSPPNITLVVGGIGGNALTINNTNNQIFLGGGGGAGHENDSDGSAGGNGGGIVIIHAGQILGNYKNILAEGEDVPVAGIDGQGGGGAGGTVLLDIPYGGMTYCNVSVEGGDGGTDNYSGSADCHGKGGGGGGGVIWSPSSIFSTGVTVNIAGGAPGVFNYPISYCYNTSFGATAGYRGGILTDLKIPQPRPCGKNIAKLTSVPMIPAASSWNVMVFPNPSSGQITLTGFAAGENVSIRLTDITGKIIMDKTVISENGFYNMELPVEQSLYLMELKNSAGQVIHKKLQIAK